MHSPRHKLPSRTIGGKKGPNTLLPETRAESATTPEAAADATDIHSADLPLRIVVTSAAVEERSLRRLAREAIAMLRRPHDYSAAARRQTARRLNCLLDGGADTDDDEEAEEESEGEGDTDFRWSKTETEELWSEEGGC